MNQDAVIYSYTDQQAIDDGVLVRFVKPSGEETPWLCTAAVWADLEKNNGEGADVGKAAMGRLGAMIADLYLAETKKLNSKETLITNGKWCDDTGYWLGRNGLGGWTIMQPSDY